MQIIGRQNQCLVTFGPARYPLLTGSLDSIFGAHQDKTSIPLANVLLVYVAAILCSWCRKAFTVSGTGLVAYARAQTRPQSVLPAKASALQLIQSCPP